MLIGELSVATGVSARMLRYYEERGLLTPRRRANGYRDFDPADVDRVLEIRRFLARGLTADWVAEHDGAPSTEPADAGGPAGTAGTDRGTEPSV